MNNNTISRAVITTNHPHAADDALWFGRHPHRRTRIRLPRPGELRTMGADTQPGQPAVILVGQLRPGCRARVAVALPFRLALDRINRTEASAQRAAEVLVKLPDVDPAELIELREGRP